jgi:hypothetical protein
MAKLNPIEYLIDREFYSTSSKPLGENFEETIQEYRMYLSGLTSERPAELVKEEQERELLEAGRFNTPMHWPDYQYWSKMPYWCLDEAIALSLGQAPERVSWDTIEPIVGYLAFPIASCYQKRRELVLRAKESNQITDPVEPKAFLAWADSVGIDTPDTLRSAVSKHLSHSIEGQGSAEAGHQDDPSELIHRLHAQVKDLQDQIRTSAENRRSDDILSKKEARSLYKLLLGMAIRGYCWDPADKKSEKTAEIASDCQLEDLSITADTVRKWLRIAFEEVKKASHGK